MVHIYNAIVFSLKKQLKNKQQNHEICVFQTQKNMFFFSYADPRF